MKFIEDVFSWIDLKFWLIKTGWKYDIKMAINQYKYHMYDWQNPLTEAFQREYFWRQLNGAWRDE